MILGKVGSENFQNQIHNVLDGEASIKFIVIYHGIVNYHFIFSSFKLSQFVIIIILIIINDILRASQVISLELAVIVPIWFTFIKPT